MNRMYGAALCAAMAACRYEPAAATSTRGLSSAGFDAYAEAIEGALAPVSVGFGYAIYDRTDLVASGAGGAARIGEAAMTPSWSFGVMSTSKTITAAAVMHRIEAMQAADPGSISLESPIGPYLPEHWDLGPGIWSTRIRELLSHTGGIKGVNGDACAYDELRDTVEDGVDAALDGTHSYDNANYCLLRIILPYMVHVPGPSIAGDDGKIQEYTEKTYRSYVREHVLEPAGVFGAELKDTNDPRMRFYNLDDTSKWTEDASDDTGLHNAGAGYWNLSAIEYGRFISALAAGEIISPAGFALMQSTGVGGARLGMFSANGKWGTYFTHNGKWANGDGAGALSVWALFPRCELDTTKGWISTFAMVNSRGASEPNLFTVLRQAYASAVVDTDGDGIADDCDACPNDPTSDPADNVNTDGDAWCDADELCPSVSNTVNADTDGDGLCDDFDTCPTYPDPSNLDSEGDGVGDVCDDNDDNDACDDDVDMNDTSASMPVGWQIDLNCNPSSSAHWESESGHHDRDGVPDCADADDDGDGILDGPDPCPWDANETLCMYRGHDCPVSPIFELCRVGPCADLLIRLIAAINPDPTISLVFPIDAVDGDHIVLEEVRGSSARDLASTFLDERGVFGGGQEVPLRIEAIDAGGRVLADLATYYPSLSRADGLEGSRLELALPRTPGELGLAAAR